MIRVGWASGGRRAASGGTSGPEPFFSGPPLAATCSPLNIPVTAPLEIHDTDLVSTVVYSRHHYGECPAWIVGEAKKRLSDLYCCSTSMFRDADGVS